MELRISRVRSAGDKPAEGQTTGGAVQAADKSMADCPRSMVALDNGVSLIKQKERYLMSICEEEIEISADEACMIYDNPDSAFEIVIEKKRKFWFSASADNVRTLTHK